MYLAYGSGDSGSGIKAYTSTQLKPISVGFRCPLALEPLPSSRLDKLGVSIFMEIFQHKGCITLGLGACLCGQTAMWITNNPTLNIKILQTRMKRIHF